MMHWSSRKRYSGTNFYEEKNKKAKKMEIFIWLLFLLLNLFFSTKNQPLYNGERSCTIFDAFDCRNALIGLGKYQPRPFDLESPPPPPPESENNEIPTDLDLIILFKSSFSPTSFFFVSSTSATVSSGFLIFELLKTDQNDDLLRFDGFGGLPSSRSFPTNLDRERRNGIATDLERRKAGSLSMRLETRPTEPTPEESASPPPPVENRGRVEEEEEEVVQQAQGRTLAQSGHREARRSRRQIGQIPLLRRFEGCFGHFQTSSSST